MSIAGRSCPPHFGYRPEVLQGPCAFATETLYVVGGLYGNAEALVGVERLLAREAARARVVFNGDFNWFNVAPRAFRSLNEAVLAHAAMAGNVEAELAAPSGAGCGCAYPASVDAATVERSNLMMERLQRTAAAEPDIVARLRALPYWLRVQVGEIPVGIVHGDTESLAGWAFDAARLPGGADVVGRRAMAERFRRADVRVLATTHTCLPCAQDYAVDGRRCVVINNGAAGMPNFAADPRGVVSRISLHPAPVPTLYGCRVERLYVDAVALAFDGAAWRRRFLAQWPPGSPAHTSYWQRIHSGPDYRIEQAARGAFRCVETQWRGHRSALQSPRGSGGQLL